MKIRIPIPGDRIYKCSEIKAEVNCSGCEQLCKINKFIELGIMAYCYDRDRKIVLFCCKCAPMRRDYLSVSDLIPALRNKEHEAEHQLCKKCNSIYVAYVLTDRARL